MDLLWRMGYAFGISLLTAWVIAPWIIKYLKRRKWEQVFRDQKEVRDLAQLHSAKARTPTMGGIIIVIATMSGTIFLVHWNFQVIVTLCTYLAVMFMGFIDDLAKVRAQNTRGIPGRMKLLIQFGLTLVIGGILYFNPDLYERYCVLPIPFSGYSLSITPFIFFIIFLFCVLAGTSNAVNLTDGLDGLVTSCAMPVIFFLGIVSFITGNGTLATLCQCPYIAGNGELGILCASLLGALIVFLWHNGYPASIFMGDTGSLSLGILIGMVAFLTNHPFHLMIGGGIFVLEALSDIIQVFSYKFRHQRRIFKMAPLHHHFELLGVHETKITRRFGIISGLLSLLSIVGLWHFWG
ncbi:MAG: phospho-N-acetylmuramoyl-pentapeptide-transferase [Puniceicoccales bacterium]|nr:phospho-N-acetylmuramoyl-pentapeptide-transferase [Puniceicoccales bacterium]